MMDSCWCLIEPRTAHRGPEHTRRGTCNAGRSRQAGTEHAIRQLSSFRWHMSALQSALPRTLSTVVSHLSDIVVHNTTRERLNTS